MIYKYLEINSLTNSKGYAVIEKLSQ